MTLLEELIAEEIRSRGPISFRRFMELALYHPEQGYYRRSRDPFGAEGDFYTNAQLQPVFGRLLAQQVSRWREQLGAPPDFAVIELGAGRGETTQEIQSCLPDVNCLAVDIATGQLPAAFRGVVICNEFFDALPVHSVEHRGGRLIEYFVDLGEDGFEWTHAEPSDPQVEEYVKHYAPGLAEGQKIEVNLAALMELEKIASVLEEGYLLTIDYGYTSEEIAGARRFPRGSLMSYRRHRASEDVLTEPGNRDISAHVDFTALQCRGEELGLDSAELRTQMRFFMEVGEQDNFEAALKTPAGEDNLPLRMQLKTLLFGMGETFRVLVQQKRRG